MNENKISIPKFGFCYDISKIDGMQKNAFYLTIFSGKHKHELSFGMASHCDDAYEILLKAWQENPDER